MERKRSQYQRLKQQRFFVSQQDITQALTCMKPTVNHFQERQLENLKNSSSTSAIEKLDNRSVSKLVKEFEARANLSSYASAQNLLPIVNDVISNGAEFNRSHMFIRTMKFKVDDNGTLINNNVCSSISPSTNTNGNQMAKVEIQPEKYTGDKEQEKNDEQIYETLDIDHCKLDLPPPPVSFYTTIDNNNNPIEMAARSTNIDEAALAFGKRHEISFDELLAKEAQLNHVLADLISISNDTDKSFSMNSSPRSTIHKNDPRRTSSVKNDISDMSATVNLLNSLLEAFELDKEDSDKKITNNIQNKSLRRRKNDDNPLKPINTFCLMLSDNDCANCHQAFATNEQIVNAAGHIWHTNCFVCTQCFQPFENGLYFEHEDRKYCERDFQMLFAPCCAECKQAIVGRVISALGKQWHVEHFCCARCAQPFYGSKHFENKGLAYCESDYHFLFGSTCFICNCVITEGAYTACNKKYCADHFACSICEKKMNEKSKFFDVDATPVCKPCYGKLPSNTRKSIQQSKKKQLSSILKQTSV
ncbi:unnamed protein product [Rotaria magnacalcarata]|uniref:LIM zinc-binding domain-containing protein n=1 Tax=Rotaria magnacalcarata TaxID=392030 RepID=A0A816UIB7_9BILA|nr:unnamed protein product [Rotaria magnacalcarata]CAF3756976.1 unnamed protein product [Rotaria magnacalcarata]